MLIAVQNNEKFYTFKIKLNTILIRTNVNVK